METSGSRSEDEEVIGVRGVGALPDLVVRELQEDFKMFDLDGDGKISPMELGTVLRSLGETPTDVEVAHMIRDADANGDGAIDLEEFITLNASGVDIEPTSSGQPCASSSSSEALQSAFDVFDSDRDGFISAGELHRVLSGLGDPHVSMDDCRYMISCVDADGNHLVDFHEFQILMSNPPNRSSCSSRIPVNTKQCDPKP